MKHLVFIVVSLTYLNIFAAQRNLISVGQGISSPNISTNLIISNGFTAENPTGIAYQNGFRLSGEYDKAKDSNSNNGTGAEIGIGNGDMGLALGYYKRDCDTCEEDISGGFGIIINDMIGFGASGQEEFYSAGMIVNPKGSTRLGFVASLLDFDGNNNNITTYGAGLSYISNAWSFTVDASKREFEDKSVEDDTVIITPGLAMTVDQIHFSVNMDLYTNEPDGTDTDDDVWVGLGYGHGEPFNLTLYHDYIGEWTLVASLFF